MVLTYKRKLGIWNDIKKIIDSEKNTVIFSAGDLYEEIISYACVASQFEENKPALSSTSNAWSLRYANSDIEFYDLSSEKQIETFIRRHIQSDKPITYVITFELESNTLVWDAYISQIAPIVEYKDQNTIIIRGSIDG